MTTKEDCLKLAEQYDGYASLDLDVQITLSAAGDKEGALQVQKTREAWQLRAQAWRALAKMHWRTRSAEIRRGMGATI